MKLKEINNIIFESIKHIDEEGNEYWLARELQKILKYKEWRKFNKVIDKAIEACKNSKIDTNIQFVQMDKLSINVNGGQRKILDYKLSRYACYLIAQNGDSHMKVISLAQTYFAIQTRRQELFEKEYSLMSENKKRLFRRKQIKESNKILNRVALDKGVKNFDKFTNAGYKGLYNGETANDIAKRKGLRYREDILDNMGSVELGANIFRITQTEDLLRKQCEKSEKSATNTHYKVGKKVRQTIKELGGTMPEDLPKPEKSLKELEKYNNSEIKKINL